MTRLPTVGGDDGNWGTILNEFLSAGHNSDGSLKSVPYVVNVKDYGAKGDSSTDDTTALQNAINTGNQIYLPTGTYKITSKLNVSSNKHIFLESGVTIKASSSTPFTKGIFHLSGVDNVCIEGRGTLDGDKASYPIGRVNGVVINDCTNIIVRGISIKNMPSSADPPVYDGDGIYIGYNSGGSSNIIIEDVIIDNVARNGISITYADGVSISKVKITNSGYEGIDLEPNSGASVSKMLIDECDISASTYDGLVINGGHGAITYIDIFNCKIYSNTLSGIVGSGSTVPDYIRIVNNHIWSNTLKGIFFNNVVNTQIVNNYVHDNSEDYACIFVNATNSVLIKDNVALDATNQSGISIGSTGKFQVVNNRIEQCYTGIGTASANYALIAGNIITNCTDSGINIKGSIHHITASQNDISNTTRDGIYVESAFHCSIVNNNLYSNGRRGIYLADASNNAILNNTVSDNSTSANDSYDGIVVGTTSSYNSIQGNFVRKGSLNSNKQRFGILISGTDATKNLVANNNCYDAGSSGGISNTGTGTLFGGGNIINDGSWSTSTG